MFQMSGLLPAFRGTKKRMNERELFFILRSSGRRFFSSRIRRFSVFVVSLGIVFFTTGRSVMAFEIKSDAFEDGQMIPLAYTCMGQDVSCPLSWSEPPQGTVSFVLICDDPDAPMGTWVHWVMYNIPAQKTQLPEGLASDSVLQDGSRQGVNDFGKTGYGGPCPPPGQTHRYYFKMYALDILLDLDGPVTKKDLERVMRGHVLGQATMVGKFRK